jgi:hypothetical protein
MEQHANDQSPKCLNSVGPRRHAESLSAAGAALEEGCAAARLFWMPAIVLRASGGPRRDFRLDSVSDCPGSGRATHGTHHRFPRLVNLRAHSRPIVRRLAQPFTSNTQPEAGSNMTAAAALATTRVPERLRPREPRPRLTHSHAPGQVDRASTHPGAKVLRRWLAERSSGTPRCRSDLERRGAEVVVHKQQLSLGRRSAKYLSWPPSRPDPRTKRHAPYGQDKPELVVVHLVA